MEKQTPNVRAVFEDALEIEDPADRAAYLNRACAAAPEIRRQVEALLRAHAEAGSFLESLAPGSVLTAEEPIREGPGTLIGPYKLLEQIGEGGFGVVFMAEQTQPVRRKVALKVIKPGMDTRQVIARFEAERQALALMDHPNIAKVLDAGTTASGRPYFVMELVKGVPITRYCDEYRLTPRQRLELFVPVCQAVQHAHQKGIIHRDLKPSNVLVALYDDKPVVKVIDFGIAKAIGQQLTEHTLYTGFGAVVGTFEYMSPEQAGFNQLDIDTRSDIYSLGVLLYELLTGTTPLDRKQLGDSTLLEVLRTIREVDPQKPSTRLSTADGLPMLAANRGTEAKRLTGLMRGELDWIVMTALSKDRSRRYETANALAMDVRRYLNDEPVWAGPPSALYKLRKFIQRNQVVLTSVVTIALAMMLGTAVSTWQAIRASQAEKLALTRLHSETKARTEADDARQSALERLYQAKLAQARGSRYSHRVGQRVESWRAIVEAAELAHNLNLPDDKLRELRNEAIACLATADVRRLKQWEGFPPGSSAGLAFDANLEHYARGDLAGNISVRRVKDDHEVTQLPGQGSDRLHSGAASMRFSPDGRLLAVRYWNTLRDGSTNFLLWDWRQGQVVLQPEFLVNWNALAFSADGRRLALGHTDGTVTLHEAATGKEVKRFSGELSYHLAFHPDGTRLAVGCSGAVEVRELATGKTLDSLPAPGEVRSVAWHPDGGLLAGGCVDKSVVCVWDAATGRQCEALGGHQGSVVGVTFAPDGTLLSWAWDGTCRLWDPWTGQELLRFAGGDAHFSKDGRLATHIGHDLALWEWIPGREYRTLPSGGGREEGTEEGCFSPDGRWFAGGTTQGVRLWDAVSGMERAFLPLGGRAYVKFHPAGDKLFTSGRHGLYQWPLRREDNLLKIGPARRLPVPGALGRISLDREGQIIAGVRRGMAKEGWVHDREKASGKPLPLDHQGAMSVAVSPDGRWVAIGTHNGFGVKVWDAHSGELVHDLLPDARITTVSFSPDGRWFVVGGVGYHVWQVNPWQFVRTIRGVGRSVAFTSDGEVMALTLSQSMVHLVDPETRRPLARLEAPAAGGIGWMGFSPDGSQLAVVTYLGAVKMWDLRRIRKQLREIDLDWDLPVYPPRPRREATPPQVEVDLADFRRDVKADEYFVSGLKHARSGQWRQAIAGLSKCVELSDEVPWFVNNLAWLLCTCPKPELRDPARAVRLAERAVQLAPAAAVYWNTLGVCHYRAGNWKSAIAALEKSHAIGKGRYLSYDGLFLAMAHWQLGEKDTARRWYDKAVRRIERNQSGRGGVTPPPLLRFRAEAEELLK